MSLRPPRMTSSKARESVLGYEIAQEQAAALGRLGRALEAALAALSQHDGQQIQSAGRREREPRPAPCVNACPVRPVTRSGALSFSGRPADCAINA